MKKSLCLLLAVPLLLTGCETDEDRAIRLSEEASKKDKIYGEGYVAGYQDGFQEGVTKFRAKFDEEIAPAYNSLQQSLLLYTNNVCIIDDVHNKYHSNEACWDMLDVKTTTLMFIDDAEAEGYAKCQDCYEYMDYYPMPSYDELTKDYEPEECPGASSISYPTDSKE